jgi:glycosyltransferase involved in cell wall biosynthesis
VHQQGLMATLIVHDLIPIAHPEWFPTDANKRTLESIVHSVTEKDQVVCVSESTRQDLLAYRTDLRPKQVTVAHLAGAEVFKPTPLSDTLRQRIGINFEYILSVCTLEPRKNLQLVVRAYEHLLQNNVDTQLPQLVLVGAIGWKTGELIDQINMLNAHHPNQVIITGYIEDEELAQLYTSATMFVYPSLYEGFGLPPLEAMQCGCPVITSNVSSLPEVVGAAGITINPTDFNMLVSAMEKIRHDGRDKYAQQSLDRSGEFSWREMAQQVIKTIE